MNDILLSIIIPTYNRDLLLNANLYNYQFLTKYINLGKVEVVIIDNNSSDNTSRIVSDFSKSHFEIKYFKNVSNIGGSANILRCFEASKSNWVWIIPDDVYPNIITFQNIMNLLDSPTEKNLIFLNHKLNSKLTICDSKKFIDYGFLTSASWLPTVIYPKDTVLNSLNFAYDFIPYAYPHVAILYKLLYETEINRKKNIHILYDTFKHINNFNCNKYSYISGSLVNFGLTVNKLFPKTKCKKILKLHKKNTEYSLTMFRLLFYEHEFIDAKELYTLIKLYGPINILFLLLHLFLSSFSELTRMRIYYFLKSRLRIDNNFKKFYSNYLQNKYLTRKHF